MRDRRLIPIACAALLAVFTATAAPAKVIHIDITKLVFEPRTVAAEIGDTIEWTNNDIVAHTATADDKSWEVALAPHATGSYVIERAGVAAYFCRFHPNMRGVVKVAEP